MTQDEHIKNLSAYMDWLASYGSNRIPKAEALQKFIELVIEPMKEEGQEPKPGG